MVRISWQGASVGLAMGMRTQGEVHWWETCALTVEEEAPFCRVIEAGGAIAHRLETREDRLAGAAHPYLHNHNWLNGHIYARLYANGVCEVFAHHINSKSADDGLDLEDAVPVIGIKVEGAGACPSVPEDVVGLCGPWDGSVTDLRLGSTLTGCTRIPGLGRRSGETRASSVEPSTCIATSRTSTI